MSFNQKDFQKGIVNDEIMIMKNNLESIKEQNKILQTQLEKFLNYEGDKFNFSDLSQESPIILEIKNMSELQVKKMASSLYRDYRKVLGERNGFISDRISLLNEINNLQSISKEKDKFLENMGEKVELLIQENRDLKIDIFKLQEKTHETEGIPLEDSYVNVDYKKN